MPQFRTIEEFVLFLEGMANAETDIIMLHGNPYSAADSIAESIAYVTIAHIVRASNLGIVHPYSEEECPGHISASQKICCNCGIHIDSLRPD